MKKKQEYNWIDDPFDEKKGHPAERGCSGTLAAAGLVAAVLLVALALVAAGAFGLLSGPGL